jgi:hypothetical protein
MANYAILLTKIKFTGFGHKNSIYSIKKLRKIRGDNENYTYIIIKIILFLFMKLYKNI